MGASEIFAYAADGRATGKLTSVREMRQTRRGDKLHSWVE
jgi:hypothetical protein